MKKQHSINLLLPEKKLQEHAEKELASMNHAETTTSSRTKSNSLTTIIVIFQLLMLEKQLFKDTAWIMEHF